MIDIKNRKKAPLKGLFAEGLTRDILEMIEPTLGVVFVIAVREKYGLGRLWYLADSCWSVIARPVEWPVSGNAVARIIMGFYRSRVWAIQHAIPVRVVYRVRAVVSHIVSPKRVV